MLHLEANIDVPAFNVVDLFRQKLSLLGNILATKHCNVAELNLSENNFFGRIRIRLEHKI